MSTISERFIFLIIDNGGVYITNYLTIHGYKSKGKTKVINLHIWNTFNHLVFKCRTPVIHVFLVCIDARLTCTIGEEKAFKLKMKLIVVIIAYDNPERAEQRGK